MEKIRIGISACLLGEKVRFDGGHKIDHFLVDTLGQYVDFVPVCPEVELGLPTPRETLRLIGGPDSPKLVFSKSGEEITGQMIEWSEKRVHELEKENLCGFIFKSKSPSSGMERVKLYDKNGVPTKTGIGLFARTFMEHFPLLPVEEDGRLHDPKLRENFIESIFTLKRWRDTVAKGKTIQSLVDFHTRHKLLTMAHSVEMYREMGKMVARAKGMGVDTAFIQYESDLCRMLRLKTTVKKNTNVLQHILGYFKKDLTNTEKQEALALIDQYRNENIPLIVPITLLNHYINKYDQAYLKQQVFLHPHPVELKLRNHV